jgi:hypothetical protein
MPFGQNPLNGKGKMAVKTQGENTSADNVAANQHLEGTAAGGGEFHHLCP